MCIQYQTRSSGTQTVRWASHMVPTVDLTNGTCDNRYVDSCIQLQGIRHDAHTTLTIEKIMRVEFIAHVVRRLHGRYIPYDCSAITSFEWRTAGGILDVHCSCSTHATRVLYHPPMQYLAKLRPRYIVLGVGRLSLLLGFRYLLQPVIPKTFIYCTCIQMDSSIFKPGPRVC